MAKRVTMLGACVAAISLLTGDALAQQPSVAPTPRRTVDAAIALKASTLGLGAEASKLLGSHLALRVGGQFASYNDGEVEEATDVKLKNASGFLDLFPWGRKAFRFTGGIVTGTTSVAFSEGPDFVLGDNDNLYTGTLTETLEYPRTRPYAGFGWGTPASRRGGLGFVADFGVLFGKPKYSITAVGTDATDPQLLADLEAERQANQETLNSYGFYPVIGLGLAYRF